MVKRLFGAGMFTFLRCVAVVLCCLLPATGECAQNLTDIFTPEVGQEGKDVLWIPTVPEHIDILFDLAKVTPSDYVIDLGSGDGRFVITAAKRGARALGIEYDSQLVTFSRRAAARERVSDKAKFERADFFETDFSQATVLTLFLLEEINLKLRPKILDMAPGTRVVSNSFGMGEWEADATRNPVVVHPVSGKTAQFPLYLWIVPAKVEGTWKSDDGQITFIQKFQKITGTLTAQNNSMDLVGKLDGAKLTFTAGGMEYTGTVSDGTISGTRADGKPWQAAR